MSKILLKLLNVLEPENVYEQASLPKRERTIRMRVADGFYHIFQGWM